MDKQLRDLAFAIVKEKTVKSDQIEGFLENISMNELRMFLKYLQLAQNANTITVTTTADDKTSAEYFRKKYPEMHVDHKIDDTIGAGVIVKIGDDVYDYTVRNYIDTTITQLTNEL